MSSLALVLVGSLASASGLDLTDLDGSVEVCSNFYQHVCGGWMAKNPIPADQSVWGRFEVLNEHNLVVLREILDQAAAGGRGRSANEQKIDEFYGSCMDEKTVEQKDLKPLEPLLERIERVKDKSELASLVAYLHAQGSDALFGFWAEPDKKNAKQYLAAAYQGGMGLPDRDYYVREDASSTALRDKYVAHVGKMLELAGASPAQAAIGAKTVMGIETRLAKAALDLVSRRDPTKTYHKMGVEELVALGPSFDWKRYFVATAAAPAFQSLNVTEPEFVRGLDAVVQNTALSDLKIYLRWQALRVAAPYLSGRFVDANFEFYGKALRGARELKPRWKRCVEFTDQALGEALGKIYVEKTFGAEGKKRTLAMVQAIERALDRDIRALDWMTDGTKKQALVKLAAIANKIGYPDKWRDYRALSVVRGDMLGNALRANAFEVGRWLQKIDTPVDRGEWYMTPPTVNAYYGQSENNINFPAGILQPPFFRKDADDALNFGAIGSVIGHELTHGFDDEGRKFDARGNLRDWWTPQDSAAFAERAACFVNQYASYSAVDELKLNGQLTLGENVADNGGLRVALMAFLDSQGGKMAGPIDGFTPVQRFFLGYARIWCENVTPEVRRLYAQTDPHSPPRYRVNGVVANMPEFRQAFGCKSEAPMVRANGCRVW